MSGLPEANGTTVSRFATHAVSCHLVTIPDGTCWAVSDLKRPLLLAA
jgi:hypothetical protein